MTLRPLKTIGLAVVLFGLCSCNTGPTPEPTSTPSTPSMQSSAVSPSGNSSPTETSQALPPSPDPSTAGSLDATSLPQEFLGFKPEIRDPEEGEFVPNGTWVFGQDPVNSAEQTWPRCGGDAPPPPAHALMGLYADAAGAPGVGQAFEFPDAGSAERWFDAYASNVAACVARGAGAYTAVAEYRLTPGSLVDRRTMAGAPWSESAWTKGKFVLLIAIQRDATLDELAAARG